MPHYNLDSIREVAKQERIEYRGGRNSIARKTIANLGYSFENVVDSIASLTPSDFVETYKYLDQSIDDGYIVKFFRGDEMEDDKVFMKLRLLNNGEIEIVEIGTAHLPKR